MPRRNNGRYTTKRKDLIERLVAPWLLVVTVSASVTISEGSGTSNYIVRAKEEPQPIVKKVQDLPEDVGGQLTVSPEPTPEPTQEEQIIAYIHEVFGKDAPLMVKVFTCESGLNPETIGDKHLIGMYQGELVGDSVGIAQIRTGDAGIYDSRPWKRAKGMTTEELRTKLKDYKYNIDYAKTIYDSQGINAWFNCKNKVKDL